MPRALLLLMWLCGVAARAGTVTLDGTVGPRGSIVPDANSVFTIDASVGATRGNNLFHSFGEFNLKQGDTASFTGPANIQNILARVTGGASTIDGTIDTTGMPNANFFLINPFGITFGPNAVINVGGSVAITTADYVKLAGGGRFDARNPANDVLTTAPVSAFGFLGPTAAPITLAGVTTDPNNPSILTFLPDGKSIWIVGGNIEHDGFLLGAPGGEIVIVSVASAGELSVNVDDPRAPVDTKPFAALGTITLAHAASLYTDGTPGGMAVMEADRISLVDNCGVSANNYGDTASGGIVVRARTELDLSGSSLSGGAFGNGDAGNILVSAPTIQLTAQSGISSGTIGNGRSGDIHITADNFSLLDGGGVAVSTGGAGAGGNLVLTADHVLIEGNPAAGTQPVLQAIANGGPAGSIVVQANTVELLNGGAIVSDGGASPSSGQIHVTAHTLVLDDQHGTGLTTISSRSRQGTALGGEILLDVNQLQVRNGAQITTSTETPGAGGNIVVHAGTLTLDMGASIASSASSSGKAGSLTLTVGDNLLMQGHSSLSVSADQSAGGDITINAGRAIYLIDSRITGQALDDGGNVRLTAPSLIYLFNSTVTAASAAGNGGNVFLDPTLIVLNHSSVAANALLNNGGNISLVSDFFLPSASRLDASGGPAGIQGTVLISAPSLDLAGNFVELPDNLVDAGSLLTPHCAIRRPRGASSFTSADRGALPAVPDGLLPALPDGRVNQ